ncbi:MAG: FkbM family methyltransferase [Afipia felis]|nr:FkbM family methyltransferase [Afipia felis]
MTEDIATILTEQTKAKRESDDAFNNALIQRIASDFNNFHSGNWDVDRFGPEPENKEIDKKTLQDCCAQIHQFNGVGYLYNVLSDSLSKEILVGLFAFLIMGYRKVRLQRNNEFYWKSMQAVHSLPKLGELKIPVPGLCDFDLKLLDLRTFGYDLKFFIPLLGANITFLQKQYELHHGDVHCKADAGDVVIDAGGCWGDTALYFAHEVGPDGKVVSFEFIPSNLEVMRKNLEFNTHLIDRITVVPQPLWSTPGNALYYVDRGPASNVSSEKIACEGAVEGMCTTATIDQTVEKLGLDKIDFIKMDIEGAELASLKGAEKTLRRFKPKLAICLYHGINDFRSIPRYIDSLDLGYKFYLDHATIQWEETVLFCVHDPATEVMALRVKIAEMTSELAQRDKQLVAPTTKKRKMKLLLRGLGRLLTGRSNMTARQAHQVFRSAGLKGLRRALRENA